MSACKCQVGLHTAGFRWGCSSPALVSRFARILALDREWTEPRGALRIEFQHMVDHVIHRITAESLKEFNGPKEQAVGSLLVDLRKCNETRVDRLVPQKVCKIADVLGDDDSILRNAVVSDRGIELASASDVQRMNGIVADRPEPCGKARRKALIDKQTQISARSRQGSRATGERMRLFR